MLSDIVNSIKATLYDRTSSPLFGSFALAWLPWNYRLVVVLLGDGTYKEKLEFVSTMLYPSAESLVRLWGVYPLVTALLFIFIYPWPARWVYAYSANQRRRLRELRREIEGDELITAEEARRLRVSHAALELEFDANLRAMQQDRDTQREVAAQVEARRASLEKERDEMMRRLGEQLRPNTSKSDRDASFGSLMPPNAQQRTDDFMRGAGQPDKESLVNTLWRLTFDPNQGEQGWKSIHLGRDGQVTAGQNHNEWGWRVTSSGQLEFLQRDGHVHSRFNLDRPARQWMSRKEPDLGQKTPLQYLSADAS